ncbi:MAG TPA: carbon storage regulator [Gemmataceae bacterium]|nr:carbon storage regulator [Gemmataceae bacterium]
MLVLSRRPGETIRIGSDITITVLEISGNRIRVGIDAPAQLVVLRGELDNAAVAARTAGPCSD